MFVLINIAFELSFYGRLDVEDTNLRQCPITLQTGGYRRGGTKQERQDAICEQQSPWPACACVQTGQGLRCSLYRFCYIHILCEPFTKTLIILWECESWSRHCLIRRWVGFFVDRFQLFRDTVLNIAFRLNLFPLKADRFQVNTFKDWPSRQDYSMKYNGEVINCILDNMDTCA